jgi:hypothetical protein
MIGQISLVLAIERTSPSVKPTLSIPRAKMHCSSAPAAPQISSGPGHRTPPFSRATTADECISVVRVLRKLWRLAPKSLPAFRDTAIRLRKVLGPKLREEAKNAQSNGSDQEYDESEDTARFIFTMFRLFFSDF